MGAQKAVGAALAAHERVAVDDAQVAPGLQVALHEVGHGRSHDGFDVAGLVDAPARQRDAARQVQAARAQQPACEDGFFGPERPYRLALVDGVDVVNLHAYVAARVRPVERVDAAALCGDKGGALLPGADAQAHGGYLREGQQACLEVVFASFYDKREVGGQRHFAERRYEDAFGAVGGRWHHVVRALAEIGKEPCLKQQFRHLPAVGRARVEGAKVDALLRFVCLDFDTQQFAALTPHDGFHRAACRRRHVDGFRGLVREQRTAGQHVLAFLHEETHRHAVEVVRADGAALRASRRAQRERGFAFQPQVQAFSDFECSFHVG